MVNRKNGGEKEKLKLLCVPILLLILTMSQVIYEIRIKLLKSRLVIVYPLKIYMAGDEEQSDLKTGFMQ